MLLFLTLPISLLVSCGGQTLPTGVEGAVVDDADNPNKLRQLLLVIQPVDTDGRTILVDRIDTVKVKVDGKPWGIFSSDSLETEDLPTMQNGPYTVTDVSLGYFVLAEYLISVGDLRTAGDFAGYLYNRLSLPPGDHVCEVAEVQFRDDNGDRVVIRPHTYTPFTVEENIASVYLGEIEITVR